MVLTSSDRVWEIGSLSETSLGAVNKLEAISTKVFNVSRVDLCIDRSKVNSTRADAVSRVR